MLVAATARAQTPEGFAWIPFAAGFTEPTTIQSAKDGTGRLFVVEKPGVVRMVTRAGMVLPEPLLDFQDLVSDNLNEKGMLGMTFHPDYASNGRFFVSYRRHLPGMEERSVMAEYQVSADPNVADPLSNVTIIEVIQTGPTHHGGTILFGPDDYLYLGLGDGGPAMDGNNNAQTSSTLLGSFIRIDVDTPAPASGTEDYCGFNPNLAYSVSADNPFAGTARACDEIWTYGWRHPWRFSFDRETGVSSPETHRPGRLPSTRCG